MNSVIHLHRLFSHSPYFINLFKCAFFPKALHKKSGDIVFE